MKKGIEVKQRDISDCGAACLASVAAYYGLGIPVSRIRKYAGTSQRGTSMLGLIEAATELNFQARGARAAGISLPAIPLPAIFHVIFENGLQHFVVVYKVTRKLVRYMDPASGKMVKHQRVAFSKSWTGVVLLLVPTEHFRKGNEKKSAYVRFWQLIRPHRSLFGQILLGAVVYTLLGLSTSLYVQKIIDFVLPDGNRRLMNILGLLMILLLCFQTIIGYFKSLIALRTGQRIDSRLIMGYYKHLLQLPQSFFDSMRVGEIISRVNDALRIRVFINDTAVNMMVYGLTVLTGLTVMFIYHWKLALILVITLPLYMVLYWINDRVNKKWQRKMMENGAALESQLLETIQGVNTIRRFGVQEFFNLKTELRFIPLMRSVYVSSRNGLMLAGGSSWVTGMLTIIILWSGSYFVLDNLITPGELLSFYTLTAFFTTPVQALIGANRPMQDALIAADRLFEILDLELEKENEEGLVLETFPDGDIIFDQIHFKYGGGNPVFRDLQIRIPRGRMTAILGESGCGKSTLVSLLQKIYTPDQGKIQIGDTDIRYLSSRIFKKNIAAVPQQTDLFQGDFIHNIALGPDEPDSASIFNICQRLGLHEFITGMPAGYRTIIREQGMNLSGGQKQRIGIARALYRDPSILILDEATSALDPESERKVKETLRWFLDQQRTVIIIAHRLTMIQYCAGIIFLKEDGRAISGTHEQLLSNCAEYAEWFQR